MTLRIKSRWVREANRVFESTLQPAEDEATLGELGIHVGQTCLTQAFDSETNTPRDGANLSAYRLAEWLAWHWWRLRWEPARQRRRDVDWSRAHDIACIGGGWLWPNITIKSDGVRIVFDARPSERVQTEPLHYTTGGIAIIPAATFEEGIDDFVECVLTRLAECAYVNTDLHSIWSELSAERKDREISLYRRFEAYLGFDPDEAEPELVEQLIAEGNSLGLDAISEAAADDHQSALELHDAAQEFGFDARPGDGVRSVSTAQHVDRSQVPAWQVGVEAAHQLRQQEHLGDGAIPNARLAELCGISEQVLSRQDSTGNIAFAFALDDENRETGRVVLRSAWEQGRRFAIARLLVDRLLADHNELLHPATGTYTYRQKMQRAFAGEFLCPIHSLLAFLHDDFSDENQQDAAEHFNVSPLAVTARLVDNGDLDREELQDPEAKAA